MTTIEFLKEKNRILREELGLPYDLIPIEQMENVRFYALNIDTAEGSCPYCLEFYTGEIGKPCGTCPMSKAGNECGAIYEDDGDTWTRYTKYCEDRNIKIHTFEDSLAYPRMKALIDKYNKKESLTYPRMKAMIDMVFRYFRGFFVRP